MIVMQHVSAEFPFSSGRGLTPFCGRTASEKARSFSRADVTRPFLQNYTAICILMGPWHS